MIGGLKIFGGNKKKAEWINLTKVFLRKTLPVEKEEIAAAEKIKKWNHLNPLKKKLPREMILR